MVCAEDLSYSMTMNVTSVWEKLKRVPKYKEKAGDLIFSR